MVSHIVAKRKSPDPLGAWEQRTKTDTSRSAYHLALETGARGYGLSLLICKWGQQHGRLSLARGGKAQEGSRAGSAQSFMNVRCHYCCCSWETRESIKSQVLCSGLRGLREAPWASISAPWGLRQSPPSLGPGLSGPCWPAHRCWWPGSLGVRIPPPTCPERRDC